MPPVTLPPTPAASTDIPAKDEPPQAKGKRPFTLPSPAITPAPGTGKRNKVKASQADTMENSFSLPPPPTRSRKIIQMRPKQQRNAEAQAITRALADEALPDEATSSASAKSKASGKKKPTSAGYAGKKIARKTAHSVIERRRRSKMNDEFGVLKNMIPACKDQDMHKLAILQVCLDPHFGIDN